MILSYAQLKGLWLNASKGTKYHSNTWATLMAAIAEAESGGNANAQNDNDNGGTQSSFGLWQISTGTHTPPAANWADPSENAKLAIAKLNTPQGLSAWGTYDSGAYKAYMHGATTPDPNVPGNPDGAQAQLTAAQAQDCLVGFPGIHIGIFLGHGPTTGSACLLTKSSARALMGGGMFLAGGVLMLGGVGILVAAAAVRVAAPVLSQINGIPVLGSYTGAATNAASSKLSYTPKKGT